MREERDETASIFDVKPTEVIYFVAVTLMYTCVSINNDSTSCELLVMRFDDRFRFVDNTRQKKICALIIFEVTEFSSKQNPNLSILRCLF